MNGQKTNPYIKFELRDARRAIETTKRDSDREQWKEREKEKKKRKLTDIFTCFIQFECGVCVCSFIHLIRN